MLSQNPINPLLYLTDSYKVSHINFETDGVKEIYSNMTARFDHYMQQMCGDAWDNKFVVFGTQYMIKRLNAYFDSGFFARDKDEVISEMKIILGSYIGQQDFEHFEKLHDLGFLPIEIRALQEGVLAPIKTPFLTIRNTLPSFEWLPNYLETIISSELWKSTTIASIARLYRIVGDKFALETTGSTDGVEWQNHDFSFRGQSGWESSAINGVAFLLSSCGTDNIPALYAAKQYYNSSVTDGLLAASVSAGEHSVTTLGILTEKRKNPTLTLVGAETNYVRMLLTERFKTGIVSYVADSFDYFAFLTQVLPNVKDDIMQRDGKFVVRGDSGNPVLIICGDATGKTEVERKGTIEHLWDLFGGTINELGYKVLDSHVGMIYGDGITLQRQQEILQRLKDKGFASTNVVFGVGSYSLNLVSRDHLGMAVKATNAVVDINGEDVDAPIYKDPKTDSSKKSARGLIRVDTDVNGVVTGFTDNVERESEKTGGLMLLYRDGVINEDYNQTVFQIRDRLWNKLGSTL